MEVAAGAMSPLLRKLCKLLVGEYNLEKRVTRGVRSLHTELELMHAVLRKVGQVPPEQLDEQVRIWAGKVRELSYEMEDAVDRFVVRIEEEEEGPHHHQDAPNMKNRVKKFLRRTTRMLRKGKALHQISSAIKEAQELTKELHDLRQRYELGMPVGNTEAAIDPRVMALYKDVTELVGVDNTRDDLIKMLLTEGSQGGPMQQLKTMSIVGFGGLGKTTLAKAVYDRIKPQFDCAAFISVSQNPDTKKVLKDFIYELDKSKYELYKETRDVKQLIDVLSDFLRGKRYLITIDDMWDEKVWGFIKCAFYKNMLGSRLITTTRIVSVSEACCSSDIDIIYKMKPLTVDDSRKLFYKRIFPSQKGCPRELEEVSRDILKKCGGVPLAIITIASLLASNSQIKTKEQWYVLLNSIGRGLTEDAGVEDMKRILSFSYDNLPSHLKTCLLYLSIFPEDSEISRDRLIWRWIAEGFVQCGKQDTRLFEVGENYFTELINKSMIQPICDDEGRAKACRVHDMVLDLICSLSKEENFVTLFHGKRGTSNLRSKVRRLSLQNTSMVGPTTLDPSTMSMLQLRSLTLFSPAIDVMPPLQCFEALRVLDFEGCSFWKLPDKINFKYVTKLLHLRYLGLRNSSFNIPMDIGKLHVLQTLDLKGSSCTELPSSVVRLQHLVCLYLEKLCKLPVGMGKLSSLEELRGLSVDYNSQHVVKELANMTELRVLQIGWGGMGEIMDKAIVESLGNLHKLQSLDIVPYDLKKEGICPYIGGGHIDLLREGWVAPPQLRRFTIRGMINSFLTLPLWISPSMLPLLSHLQIWVDEVREEDIQILGMLPSLRYLCLGRGAACPGIQELATDKFVVTADAFPRVRECRFMYIVTVPSMFPRGAMPIVQVLEFTARAQEINSGNLELDMGHLPFLEEVHVDLWCYKASVEEVERAEDALRLALDTHPRRPTLHIDIRGNYDLQFHKFTKGTSTHSQDNDEELEPDIDEESEPDNDEELEPDQPASQGKGAGAQGWSGAIACAEAPLTPVTSRLKKWNSFPGQRHSVVQLSVYYIDISTVEWP